MNPRYPKTLSWQAKRARIPLDTAKSLWIEAVRDATEECAIVESPEYWKSAADHLRRRVVNEVRARRSAPLGWGSYIRLPATQWFYALTTVSALIAIGARTASAVQRRPFSQAKCHLQ